jgi:FkbM family methyltransferase
MGMAIKNPVIVTALYDIGRDNWDVYNISYNTYLNWLKNTLSINAKIVIYTEEKFYDYIYKARKQQDPDFENTIIIVNKIEDLECYKKYNDRITSLMISDDFIKKVHHPDVPEMKKPLYNIIMFNKLYFLKNTKDNNFFDSDLLIWADAGGLRDDIFNYKGEVWPSIEKINSLNTDKPIFFSHSDNFDIEDREFYAMSQIRNIQGTSFFVPTNKIDDLLKEFNKTIRDCLENKYIGSDEKIFDITYCKNKDAYHLIKCTWRTYFDLFKNNNNPKKNIFLDFGTHKCQGITYFIDNELYIDKNWEIHLFEPNPLITIDSFIEKYNEYNITFHKKAVWIKKDRVIFKQYGNDGTSQGSLLKDTNGGTSYMDYYGEVEVDCIDVFDFIKSFDADSNIFIKMDIEWAEYEIIKYLLNLGWPTNIKKIWVEWHGMNETFFINKSDFLMEQIRLKGCGVTPWH